MENGPFQDVYFLLKMGVSKNRGTPKWMVYFMESPMNKWDDLGGFPPIFGNTQMVIFHCHVSFTGGFLRRSDQGNVRSGAAQCAGGDA